MVAHNQAESSKLASKRAAKQRKALVAALRNDVSAGVKIKNRPSEWPTNSSSDVSLQTISCPSTGDLYQTKDTRGTTKCLYLKKKGKVEVGFNERGQPIGSGSEMLSSYAGTMAREIVSILYDDWRRVPKTTKDFIWESVTEKFNIDERLGRRYTLQMVGKLWRTYKSRLRRQISKCKKEKVKPPKPNGSEKVEWDIFQKRRLSKDFIEKTRKFTLMREKQNLPYTGSRMGYARMEEKMKKESSNPSSITRVDVWCRGHTKKSGEASSEYVADCLNKIQEFKASSSNSSVPFKDDALTHVLGREYNGRLRGAGFGATQSKIGAMSQSNEKVAQLEKKIETLMEKMDRMGDIIFDQKTLIDSFNMKLMHSQGPMAVSDDQMTPENIVFPKDHGSNYWKADGMCKLINWMNPNEVVAEGRWITNDSTTMVHCLPLGNNASKVWVVKAIIPAALLWRLPDSEIDTIGKVVGMPIAWPTDNIIMERGDY